jgi:hypothetical protein
LFDGSSRQGNARTRLNAALWQRDAVMNVTPPAVRILPIDSQEEFPEWSIEKLQSDFFLDDLPFRSDGYLYRKSGLQAEPGTVALFQFSGAIVASAVLLPRTRRP